MNKKRFISKIDKRFLFGIAHRGLHTDKFTENGRNAFENAIKNDIAFEFDVHLTKDNNLVVIHDENLKRTAKGEGIVEDMTLDEIKMIHLKDDSEILTLEELLELNNERVPMVIELKVFRKNYKALVKRVKPVLKTIKDKSKVMLISFDPRALIRVRNTGFLTSFLVSSEVKWTFVFKRLFHSIDIDKKLLTEKKYINYTKRHFTNVWTIETLEDFNKVKDYVDTATFQHVSHKDIKKGLGN